jgi:hypothetical protein
MNHNNSSNRIQIRNLKHKNSPVIRKRELKMSLLREKEAIKNKNEKNKNIITYPD